MPLHDWRDDRGWDSVRQPWLTYLLEWVQARLPEGYRAYSGAMPSLLVGASNGKPDVGVRRRQPEPTATPPPATTALLEPDLEAVARFEFDPQHAIFVGFHGQLVAAIEVVSPRNKDRGDAKEGYAARYLGYLRQNVHLMLIDLLPRPAGVSFVDAVAAGVGLAIPATPPPCAASFRVRGPVPQGDVLAPMVAVWRRAFQVGQPLPALPLPLNDRMAVTIDLEETYSRAAKRAYLD